MKMKTVNDVMETVEDETRYIDVDGKPVSIKKILDKILNKDNENKRVLSEG